MNKYKDITYTLKKSKRKTLSIYVERDKPVTVLAPVTLSQNEIETVIDKKKYWIYKQLAEIELLNLSRVKRELVSGESFLFLGKPYILKFVDKQSSPLEQIKNNFFLRMDSKNRGISLFKEFYREKGLEKITERVEKYSKLLCVTPPQVRIMELKNRWASCSDKNINFNWKVVMSPLKIIDYIVVHELVHLKFKNHTDAFWNEVDKVMPDYWERKNWLRDNGASLELL